MKVCSKCGENKPLTEYHKCKRGPQGVQPACKKCRSDEAAKRYENNADHIKEVTRRYRQTDGRKEVIKGYVARNRKKDRAKDAVYRAVKAGTIKRQPCEVCGSNDHVVAHHDDYDYPLVVRFLCSKHHREWHRINGEAKNPC